MRKIASLNVLLGKVLLLVLFFYGCQDAQKVDYQESPAETAKNLYIIHCSRCHGVAGDLGASGSKNLKLSSFSKEEIQYIIKNGKLLNYSIYRFSIRCVAFLIDYWNSVFLE